MDGAVKRGGQEEPAWYCLDYEKTGRLIYLSHLDLLSLWERAFRRSGLPLFWRRGFRPRPRLSAGPALPLGVASRAEVLALALVRPLACDEIRERLARQLPVGIVLRRVRPGRDVAPPDRQAWRLLFPRPLPRAGELRARIEAAGPVQDRRGRRHDPAAAVLDLRVAGRELRLLLATPGGRGLRPDGLAPLLGVGRPEMIEKMAAGGRSEDIQGNTKETDDTQIADQRGRPGGTPHRRRGKR